MNCRVVLLTPTRAQGDSGFVAPTFEVYGTRWAKLEAGGGSEASRDGQPTAVAPFSLELRYDWSIAPDMRVVVLQWETALSSSMGLGATVMNVDSVAGVPTTGYPLLYVGGELVRVTAGLGTTSLTVERAVLGTVADAHADEAAVYWAKVLEIAGPPVNEGGRDTMLRLNCSEVEG